MAKKKPKKKVKKPLRKRLVKKVAKKKRAPAKKKPARKTPPKRKPVKRAPVKKRRAPKPAPKPRISPRLKLVTKEAPPPEKKEGRIEITPEIRRMWIRIRQAWVVSYQAFNHSVAMLDDRQANLMYDIVKHSLFKGSHAQILHEHPELKELIHTDEDRLCMHDVYERLSYRLNRYEKLPPDKRVYRGMKGGIGREVPEFEV